MLVLSRKPGEEIIIGDGIRISVIETRGSRVKIGIEAPKDVRIQRSELTEAAASGRMEPSLPAVRAVAACG